MFMKQTLLLLVFALEMCCINMTAQTKKQSTPKRTTTTRSTQQSGRQVMKFKQTAEDGYVWYKLKQGNLNGVRDAEGNTIIPVKYDEINYICDKTKGFHYFIVKKDNFEGAFTREGTMVVSPESRYWLIALESASSPKIDNGGMVFWIAKKENDNTATILDARGKYAFKLPEGCRWAYLNSSFGNVTNIFSFAGINYFQVEGQNNKKGIFDLDGNQIVPPVYDMCYLRNWGETISKELDGKKTEEKTSYKCGTKFNYTPFESLYYSFEESDQSKLSTSTPSTSNNNNSSDNSGNKTTTVVVEHHRDPIPVQEWQSCTNCGGEGKVMCLGACGGTGTYYVGDRLHRCSSCDGTGKKKCPYCLGQHGKYVTVYR